MLVWIYKAGDACQVDVQSGALLDSMMRDAISVLSHCDGCLCCDRTKHGMLVFFVIPKREKREKKKTSSSHGPTIALSERLCSERINRWLRALSGRREFDDIWILSRASGE